MLLLNTDRKSYVGSSNICMSLNLKVSDHKKIKFKKGVEKWVMLSLGGSTAAIKQSAMVLEHLL